jgi:patatin-related protein
MAQVPPVTTDSVRELRLALVCYGGVSLAIYMHGTTKEIHKLVRASCAYEQDQAANPFTGSGERTEAAYWNLLKQKHEQDGVRTRVVVDVITGTSAGGINGICLATALARNASQDALRNLWMDEGDISRLWQRGLSERIHWKVRALGWAFRSILRPRTAKPPLRGDRMGCVLYDTLAGMTQEGTDTLVPDGLSLELFVTMTDLRGYRRFIRIKDRLIGDRTHRVVMRFRYDGTGAESAPEGNDFTAAQAGALSFAARATSSFPGAFPPIGLSSFERDLTTEGAGRDLNRAVVAGFLPAYRAPFEPVERAWFIDGGVLDNKPFGHAIGAIVAKPASTEVRRWLVYLEPDPSPLPSGDSRDGQGDAEPSLLQTVIPSLSGIPRSEPILDELQRLRQFNERIDDVRRLVTPLLEGLPTALQQPQTLLLEATTRPNREQMAAAMNQVHEQARSDLGTTYPTYLRLKLRSIHQALAGAIASAYDYPPESAQAAFIRAVVGEWQDAKYGRDPSTDEAREYIKRSDVPYRIRRLRFVVQGVSDLYAGADPELRQQLDTAKHELYRFIDDINAVLAPDLVRDVLSVGDFFAEKKLADLLAGDPDPRKIARDQAEQLSAIIGALSNYLDGRLEGTNFEMLAHFNDISSGWKDRLRDAVLRRFIGFPLWDTAIFPLMSLSDIQQFGPIQVARFSPDGATRFSAKGSGKLLGTGVHHFGAFFSRKARECDYLWGRLDGADQLLHLLDFNESADTKALIASILDEETDSLPEAGGLIAECRRQLAN